MNWFSINHITIFRYMGTITGIGDLDPARWPNSHWRSVKVTSWFTYFLCQVKICYSFVYLWSLDVFIGWLGRVNCGWEAATRVVMGNWTFDNLSYVSILVSPSLETPLVPRTFIFSRYHHSHLLNIICDKISTLARFGP